MNIRPMFKLPIKVCLVILGTAALPAHAGNQLAMTTVNFEVPGTAAVLEGNYEEAIKASEKYIDAAFNLRRVAALTNLCISYTALGDFEDASKWCEAASEVNRAGWVTANNRAVLHLIMGEYREGHSMLESAEVSVNNGAFRKSCRECWAAIKENHEEAERREIMAQAAAEPDDYVARSDD